MYYASKDWEKETYEIMRLAFMNSHMQFKKSDNWYLLLVDVMKPQAHMKSGTLLNFFIFFIFETKTH